MSAQVEQLDVAVLGGGMAGGLLARQLQRRLPGLRIAVFERATESGYKVGESMVEIGSNYLIRRAGLSRYLYENHLPKNGLRYFFDGPDTDASLPELSEIGSVNLPFHPAFQVDRARLDADLLEMNAAAGVQVLTGAKVSKLELGAEGEPHHFEVQHSGSASRHTARWLLDASGRTSLVAKARGLRVREDAHRIASVWGRFEGFGDVDELGPESFRARVRHTSRGLSTLHFCYRGYWIWVIPLRQGVTSIGVVGTPPLDDASLRSLDGFRAFLERHRGLAELLEGAKAIDVQSYSQLAYGTEQFFSADRWGLTGEAAAFADPLYSPGADFIALENDFLTDLVSRDLEGEGREALAERTALYDDFMRFRFEAAMLLYRGQYGLIGSEELMRLKWDFDLGLYYNLWVSSYMQDQHLDARWLARELRQQRFVLKAMENFGQLFGKVEDELLRTGRYHRRNTGEFSCGLEHIDFVEAVGLPRTRREVLEKTGEIFNSVYQRAVALLKDTAPEAVAPLPITSFMVDRPLA